MVASGCAAHSRLSASSNTGTSTTSTSVGVQIQSSGLAAAILAASLLAGAIDFSREERPFPNPGALFSPAPPPAPGLAPARTVSEQDCTRPLENSGGNLKCR
jgi:hypothetical protein